MNNELELSTRITRLKQKKNAVILAHNYQIGEVQDIADFVGDSLQLSIQASRTEKDIIVFCGVNFMAETAKILSPQKMVLLPDKSSGCPMADMINADQLKELKQKYPDAVVVCYVNSTAEVKALSDICCTSSNAEKIVKTILQDKKIIFIPDKYLGSYVQSRTGREMILWNGYCPTHVVISAKQILKLKREHLDAVVIVHPESPPDVIEVADKVASTGGILDYVKKSSRKEFIIGTETGIIHRLKKENPQKIFYPASSRSICPNMKRTNLEKILWSLEEQQYKIVLDKEIMDRARKAIDRMLAVK
ncbi:MAG: quinolinate synthase NadA [Actinomycetota bacterium]